MSTRPNVRVSRSTKASHAAPYREKEVRIVLKTKGKVIYLHDSTKVLSESEYLNACRVMRRAYEERGNPGRRYAEYDNEFFLALESGLIKEVTVPIFVEDDSHVEDDK